MTGRKNNAVILNEAKWNEESLKNERMDLDSSSSALRLDSSEWQKKVELSFWLAKGEEESQRTRMNFFRYFVIRLSANSSEWQKKVELSFWLAEGEEESQRTGKNGFRFFVVRLTAGLLRMTERSRIVILTRRRRGRISKNKNEYF